MTRNSVPRGIDATKAQRDERERMRKECERELDALVRHHRALWRANLIAAHKAKNNPAAWSR